MIAGDPAYMLMKMQGRPLLETDDFTPIAPFGC